MSRKPRSTAVSHTLAAALSAFCLAAFLAATPARTLAQEQQSGSIAGRVVDDQGAPVVGVEVVVVQTTMGAHTDADGRYAITRVPVGTHTLRAREIGYKSQTASVTVSAGERATQDFTLAKDPLQLQAIVVTGTTAPEVNLKSSVAVSTLTPQEIHNAAPRSTTEMLRYVPGFTRVESSGGEVNENISMRGILGVEYVMFMEDGLPVFPTMHTFFMNADNLFRIDENIERMEVVRGGASALFGSNTPGAIINFINKTGGPEFGGTMRATAGSEGLARYDLDANGPLGEDWRFNVGGFYRYDHGARDPGFPGTKGGQVKANVTRLLHNGYVRLSAKFINDQNQFILDLPFTNANNPTFVPGFGTYGSMNTNEGLDLRVPIPTGSLTLPLGNGLMTNAQWYTADVGFDLSPDLHIENAAQIMSNHQEWNALVPSNAMSVQDFVTGSKGQAALGLPAGTTIALTYTNHFDNNGNPLPYDTPNGLVAPGQDIHVSKPITAFQDQVQIRRTFGKHTVALGGYFANYTQDNHWYFTQVLTDVRDNPRFLDAVVTLPGGTPTPITSNGFLNQLSGYANGTGTSSIVSGVIGATLQLTDRLKADVGGRVEYDNFVQSSENTSTFDLDNNPNTTWNNETFGNGSFRHFNKGITDWAGSLGLNYSLTQNLSVYGSASRGYKMPALDELLNAPAQQQSHSLESRNVESFELGVKGIAGQYGYTVNGFFTQLRNIVSQGLVIDSLGHSQWIIATSPVNRSYGAEVELFASPIQNLQLLANATLLRAELGSGAGADIGSRINGVPTSIGNVSGSYNLRGLDLRADWHWVDKRFVDITVGTALPAYSYFNFGASYPIHEGTRLDLQLLNAFQGQGLEEGNPRLLSTGGSGIFLARPILPRRVVLSMRYNFGVGVQQSSQGTAAQ